MAFKQVRLGDYFRFEKGLGYKGEFLAEESNVGLVGIDSQVPGGGYKENSEKPYSGPYKPEHVVDVGDVIVAATDITQDGSVLGSTLMIPESTNYETLIYSGDVMRAIPLKPDEFSLEYFYNLYRVKKYRTKVAYGDTGTTVRRLSEDGICEQLVPLPDMPTQIAINEIISLIDQQIANNKALSRNLEALAQSVFKSWFIDFDPVHAKKNGEKPFGMDAETAKLFPDSFVKSELGVIPKGWQVKSVSEILDRSKNKPLPASTETTRFGKTPVLEQGDSILAGFIEDKPSVIATSTAPKFIFGDHTCRMKILTKSFSVMPNTIVLNGKDIDSYWAYCATYKLQQFESYRRHWMELAVRKISVPSQEVAKAFGLFVSSLYEQKDELLFQNLELEKTISLLLPYFIDGSLTVPRELVAS
jgi:type I restriction enzyme S subunit